MSRREPPSALHSSLSGTEQKYVPLKTTVIARPLLGLGAVLGDVSDAIAVVALGSLDTVPAQMADSTASVARPLLLASASASAAERTKAAAVALGAGTGDVSGLAASVARAARARVVGAGGASLLSAVAGLSEV